MPYEQSAVRADITVGGVHIGIADKWTGGEKTADITTYRRSTGDKVLGGKPTRSDGKATYLYDEGFHNNFKKLDVVVGRGDKKAVIGITPLSDDGTPWAGGGITLTGILKTLPTPPSDWNSNDPDEIELEFALSAELA